MIPISSESIRKSMEQINDKKQDIKYDTRDYVIKYLVEQFLEDEFFIPREYQRNFVWSEKDKCKFIESILMGLPIPFMFFSDTDDGRIEIVDGAQRTQTLVEFFENDLKLNGLDILNESNGFKFKDLDISIQRRFLNTNLRTIHLEYGTTINTRQEIFQRINTSGLSANTAEIRRGASKGNFSSFLEKCTKNSLFNQLTPRTENTELRFEGLELVTRFFAYLDNYSNNYESYSGKVSEYIDTYLKEMNNRWQDPTTHSDEEASYESKFNKMLNFAEKFLGSQGFRKTPNSKSTPRARFEALSLGISLALEENPKLSVSTKDWLESDEFSNITRSDAANNKSKLLKRINYVKSKLLEG